MTYKFYMLQKDNMLIYSTYKRIDNDLFTLYSNIPRQNDRYLSNNRYLCNTNKHNSKNKTFQGIIIKITIYESNRSRREIKTAFSK